MLGRMNLPPFTKLAISVPPTATAVGLGTLAFADPFWRLNFLFQDPVNFVKFQPGFALK